MTDEHSKCERQKLRQSFWELTYGQAVYICQIVAKAFALYQSCFKYIWTNKSPLMYMYT